MTKTRFFSVIMLIILSVNGLSPVSNAQARTLKQENKFESKGISPAEFLNPDGTLNIGEGFSGQLDLSGYSVSIDPKRGPVFGTHSSGDDIQATSVTSGEWAAIGGGGSAINQKVYAVAVINNDVYVGGEFTNLDSIPAADYIARWNNTNGWTALSNDNGEGSLNGSVQALAVHNNDLYVGGIFTNIHDSTLLIDNADYIAKFDTTTSLWSGLGNDGTGNGSITGTVYDIAINGSDVYIAGSFTDIVNGSGTTLAAADYIAKFNGSDWFALGGNGGTPENGSINNIVRTLAFTSGNLYAGGYFTDVNNKGTLLPAADYIARWDGTNWFALGNNGGIPENGSLDYLVFDLAVSGSDLFVGGYFQNINNYGTILPAADYVARWDGTNWHALGGNGAAGASLNGSLSSPVTSLVMNGSSLFVGGDFSNVNNNGTVLLAADYVARWDGTDWSALGDNGAGNGSIPANYENIIWSMAAKGSGIVIGGWFVDLNNKGTPLTQANHAAIWDGTDWSGMGTHLNGSFNNSIQAITISGTNIYVGGYFENLNNHGTILPAADFIAKWDGSNWSALGSDSTGNGALNGVVRTIFVDGTDIYAGGYFTNVKNGATIVNEADGIAKWNGSTWSALGSNGNLDGSLKNGASRALVTAIAKIGSDIYVGGNFKDVNDEGSILTAADYIARWDGSNWHALGNNGVSNGSVNNPVNALVSNGTDLYVGGSFTDVNNNGSLLSAADYVAKWDSLGSGWSALGDDGSGNGSITDAVYTLALGGSSLYVGGSFTNVKDGATTIPEADFIARWDGSHWYALGGSDLIGKGSIYAVGYPPQVYSIVTIGTDVYVGGFFQGVQNGSTSVESADNIARWDGKNWSGLGSNGGNAGSLDKNVRALAISGTDLYASGYFENVNNNGIVLKEADFLAAWGIVAHAPITLTVTNLLDHADGTCDANDCTLREAIIDAMTGDHIVFDTSITGGTLTLSSTLLIDKSISITGPNEETFYISGGDLVRVFNITHGNVSLSQMRVTHGKVTDENGAGILNSANLVLLRVYVTDNAAESATSSAGGGIYNSGNLTITGGRILNNTAQTDGGGIYNAAGASLGISNCIIDTNRVFSGQGGGIYLQNPGALEPGTITMQQSSISNNTSPTGGGGIFSSASMDIKESLFANNIASGMSGAGAGIRLYEDGAGNGYAPISFSLTNSTISGNTTYGHGGGLDVSLQQATDNVSFNFVTISNNHRLAFPGPTPVLGGGGIFVSGPEYIDISNSILAGNSSAAGGSDCEGTINSADFNLIQSTGGCTINGQTAHNKTGVNPNLAPLSNNTGLTYTMALKYPSPAFDAANDLGCPDSDQRGVDRPVGSHCDMGAYEGDPNPPSITFASIGLQDGYVLETSETSNLGGTRNTTLTTLRLGDDSSKKQYRSVLSFNTSGLEDGAVIVGMTLRLKKQGITGGGNPITTFSGIMVDVKKGPFNLISLESKDFQTAASKSFGPFKPVVDGSGWYSINLPTGAYSYANKLATLSGLTQIRLRFKLDDNNNSTANFLSVYSGNASAALRPQLIIQYYVP